ncbi:AAA family ATPase [Paraconexibacter antarcticus]|uniref:Chromosome partition protein Smc n=1 Tax=Paraconexibacter antarcticus TaxID=2949664 RepID=A0ABY5DM92_9ACTN|nr:AAA family ATPase [Paraconexibacter antarcticus]UTI63096.1 AAA family ATPase [Paraconexibacter antarcticus]
MHLKSLTLKGFKSFPDRTRLEFGPGVSVVVGPNGSGKSNVTDAVLWAMGEQSPVAVRGQTMQDIIFGGGRGIQARSSAEVEIVLDNSDATVDLPFGEISIVRRLDRSGDGEYRLNGAKCRLVDVLEILSDTGLGKEMHSVVSQGRVEGIVTSKPKDRRLLIEEAAGLGKHRKRRRRAQLKLERTQDNLDRSLDVEREARSRLRPLKRQAEAAELHERLERQQVEARWELVRDTVRARRTDREAAVAAAATARTARDTAQQELGVVAARREAAEEKLAQRGEHRERLMRRASQARSAVDRIELRLERTRDTLQSVQERVESRTRQLGVLRSQAEEDQPDEDGHERIEALEAELARLDTDREAALKRELAALEEQRLAALAKVEAAEAEVTAAKAALAESDGATETARRARKAAEVSAEAARRNASRLGAELAAANQFLRSHTSAPGGARALADELEVKAGYELALSAALGGRMTAAITPDLDAAGTLLGKVGTDGGRALVLDPGAAGAASAPPAAEPPVPGAEHLPGLIGGPEPALTLARRLLADAWVVEDAAAAAAAPGFTGIAVTPEGRAWFGATRELHQAARGGSERVLVQRGHRDALIGQSEEAVRLERSALEAVEAAQAAVSAADATREQHDRTAREAERARNAAREEVRQAELLQAQRRKAPEDAAGAVRRAQIEGELAAERRVAERAARERDERALRITFLAGKLERDTALAPWCDRLLAALTAALEGLREQVTVAEAALAEERQAGEGVAAELRACASEEAAIQQRLREAGDALTRAEVRAQQLRDQAAEAELELGTLAETLGLPAEPATEPLVPQDAEQLRQRIDRLRKRREQLGPVNPLAKAEYDEALAHVEELETQRADLETALRELRTFIKDTDRQIRETFEETFNAAAKNFEELSQRLFPGGRGRLRLVREDAGPRPVLGGADADGDPEAAAEAAADAEAAAEAQASEGDTGFGPDDDVGVEIEITPAGKAMKRLTLLSGGEKSMTAIAFLFSVFLAKPCPFYILDEVEAALDDLNIGRFLDLLETYADRAQFIVVTHQKRTMEAADTLYGVTMGDDGVSKVISRKLPPREVVADAVARRSAAETAPA